MERNRTKLIINGRFLTQKPTGVQNYAAGIVKALIKAGVELDIVCPPGKQSHPEFSAKTIGFFNGFVWEQLFLALYVRKQKEALLVNLCNSAPLFIKRQAQTIHDLAFEESDKWFNSLFRVWYKFMVPWICRRAALIITVSEFSKKRIQDTYNIAGSKIIIAPPGIPDFKFQSSKIDRGNYALITGVNNPRKNAEWVLKNMDVLGKKGLKLVALGEPSPTFKNIPVKNNESVIYLKHVSFPEYCTLLKGARVLIYPSRYEGFGIPVLESLCLGTPVIASNIPALKENFGELPCYFELGDLQSFVVAADSVNVKKIVAEDIENLKNKFNFDFSALTINKAIQTII